jgi:putative flippase GtrA
VIEIVITAAKLVIVGVLAVLAAIGTGVVIMFIADRRIAFREEADRVSAATREAASVTSEQTATTVHLDGLRDAGESATNPRRKAADE